MDLAAARTRIELRTILYPTDFSPAAEKAFPCASELASRFGAKLIALHAMEPPNYTLPPELWRLPEEAAEAGFQELRESLAKSSRSLPIDFQVGRGRAWEVVEAFAAQGNADLILLGTRERTGARRFLLGSQAEEIVRRASRPVLTVGPRSREQAAPDGNPRHVLYAGDFSPAALAAAPYAVLFAEKQEGKLTLVHVIEKRQAADLVVPAELVASSGRLLRDLVPEEVQLAFEPQCIVEVGQPAERILETAERVGASLIVMGARKQAGLPGAATQLPMATVHKVIVEAPCPVLTVRR